MNLMHIRTLAALCVAGLLSLAAGSAEAACSLPYIFANGQTADANQVNTNLDSLRDCSNALSSHLQPTITSAGSANAQTLTYSAVPASGYVSGDVYTFIVGAGLTNTGATTLNINGLGAKAVQMVSAALTGGEIVAGRSIAVYYDGTQFQLVNPVAGELSALQFGAKCDGASDDAAALQVAVNWAQGAIHGATVVLPSGRTCAVASTIQITASSVGFACPTGSDKLASGPGCEIKWVGAPAGRIMSIIAPVGLGKSRLSGNIVRRIRFNGNGGLAADGLYVASLFHAHLDDLVFTGGFNGGTVLNLDEVSAVNGVNFSDAIDTQNGTVDNLSIDNSGFSSDQLRLGNYINAAGSHGNTSFDSIRNLIIVGTAGTGILCWGCDNVHFADVRVFNANRSVDLTFAQSGSAFFAANGNIFDHFYASGPSIARGTPTVASCVPYDPTALGNTCTYANEFRDIDATNASVVPTIEAGAGLAWGDNLGMSYGRAFFGAAAVQPGIVIAHDGSIVRACEANALTYAATFGGAYICDSSGTALLGFDDITGDRWQLKFTGSGGTSNLQLAPVNGSGKFDIVPTVQLDNGALPNAYGGSNLGGATVPFAAVYSQNLLASNTSHTWSLGFGLVAGTADADAVLKHDGTPVMTYGLNGIATAAHLAVTQASPSSGDACTAGQIDADTGFLYTCASTGVWKRVAVTGGY